MAFEENQVFVPDSFWALYRNERQRLTEPKEVILGYYELCEDMAQLLVERCSAAHAAGIDEGQVLRRCRDGLAATDFNPAQAQWIITRTAELMGWLDASRPIDRAGD